MSNCPLPSKYTVTLCHWHPSTVHTAFDMPADTNHRSTESQSGQVGKDNSGIWSNPPCSSRVIPEDMAQDGVQTVLWIYPVRGTLPWACIWASFYLWVFTCIISVLSFTAHVSPAAYNCCLPSILSIDKIVYTFWTHLACFPFLPFRELSYSEAELSLMIFWQIK